MAGGVRFGETPATTRSSVTHTMSMGKRIPFIQNIVSLGLSNTNHMPRSAPSESRPPSPNLRDSGVSANSETNVAPLMTTIVSWMLRGVGCGGGVGASVAGCSDGCGVGVGVRVSVVVGEGVVGGGDGGGGGGEVGEGVAGCGDGCGVGVEVKDSVAVGDGAAGGRDVGKGGGEVGEGVAGCVDVGGVGVGMRVSVAVGVGAGASAQADAATNSAKDASVAKSARALWLINGGRCLGKARVDGSGAAKARCQFGPWATVSAGLPPSGRS